MPETHGQNTPSSVQRWVDEHERHEAECQQIMIEAAAKCAPIKARMLEVKKAAKNDGISTKVFGAILLERKHLKNAAKVRDKLDEEFQDELDMLREKLAPVADLPIFGAAIQAAEEKATGAKKRKAEKAKANSDAIDSLTQQDDDEDPRPRFLKDKGETVTGDAALERLSEGIKPLAH